MDYEQLKHYARESNESGAVQGQYTRVGSAQTGEGDEPAHRVSLLDRAVLAGLLPDTSAHGL